MHVNNTDSLHRHHLHHLLLVQHVHRMRALPRNPTLPFLHLWLSRDWTYLNLQQAQPVKLPLLNAHDVGSKNGPFLHLADPENKHFQFFANKIELPLFVIDDLDSLYSWVTRCCRKCCKITAKQSWFLHPIRSV